MDLFWSEKGEKMKDLIFVGGAKGVGKTSVLKEVSKMIPIEIINTGKIYTATRIRGEDSEKAIFDSLVHHNGIVDTHYVGYKGNGFVRGLSSVYLKKLEAIKKIDLVLIDLNAKDLIERRRKDISMRRIEDYNHMERELGENRHYFWQYCEDLLTQGYVLFNKDLETCVSKLLEIIR